MSFVGVVEKDPSQLDMRQSILKLRHNDGTLSFFHFLLMYSESEYLTLLLNKQRRLMLNMRVGGKWKTKLLAFFQLAGTRRGIEIFLVLCPFFAHHSLILNSHTQLYSWTSRDVFGSIWVLVVRLQTKLPIRFESISDFGPDFVVVYPPLPSFFTFYYCQHDYNVI